MSGFDKKISSVVTEYELYDAGSSQELVKVASNNDIDLPEGFKFDPDYLYLWVRIISAGEYYGSNKNADYFPEEEILNSYKTFNSAHVFKNHENKKVEQAIGLIISVRWNPIMKCVEIFKGIDRKAAPEIVRGFLKGYLTDVSMGCKVPYTVCSVCGNKARKQKEFCDHVNKHRNEYLGNGERVFEINYEPKFHDSSAVLNGAERVAKALMIIDEPPVGSEVSFRKVASREGVSRFVRLTDSEMKKVASSNETIHPLLLAPEFEKQASATPFMRKIAELEKEVSGKLLNIVSAPENYKEESAQQMLEIIKFLTEKRFDDETLDSLTGTLKSLAKEESIPVHRVFSTLLGVAELMGIEFFPNELHKLLSKLTDASFKKELSLSDSDSKEVYPTDFAKGMKKTLKATDLLPDFKDTSSLFELYNESAHDIDSLNRDPFSFVGGMKNFGDIDAEPSVRVVKIIRQTLDPLMSVRSQLPTHLLPRLNVVLSGHRPIIGGLDVGEDMNTLCSPKTLGDMLATFAYKNYQKLRPEMRVTRLLKMATFNDSELEKIALGKDDLLDTLKGNAAYESGKTAAKAEMELAAKAKKGKGLGYIPLALGAVPAVYGASAFQKNRRDNGRNLTDAENFIADKPGIITGGIVLGGKPLSRQISKTVDKGKKAVSSLSKSSEEFDGYLEKSANVFEYEEIVKLADSFSSGRMNSFDSEFLSKFAKTSDLSGEEVSALKLASLMKVTGMDKEAKEILSFYDIPEHAIGMFLKEATVHTREEFEKAAGDFANTFILDSMIDQRSMTNSLPGRALDAFVFKKLGEIGKEDKKKKDGPDLPEPISAKGPAPYQHMKGENN